jgi:hypothetical protein
LPFSCRLCSRDFSDLEGGMKGVLDVLHRRASLALGWANTYRQSGMRCV